MELLKLKDLQKITFELLVEFDEFCKKNNIEYVLGGGTLLGAVRHDGFIPWDDDADVMMMRDQYEKLLNIVKENPFSADRQIISYKDKTFARHYAKYVRKDYYRNEEGFAESDCPWVGIDIFPIDFVPADDSLYQKQVKQIAFRRKLLLSSVTVPNSGSSKAKKAAKNVIRPIAKMLGSFRIAESMDKIEQKYNSGSKEYIAALCGMYGMRERWKYSEYEPKIRIPFEGRLFPVPENYDIYLTNLYGDYMQIPPENKRKYSHASVYKIKEEK